MRHSLATYQNKQAVHRPCKQDTRQNPPDGAWRGVGWPTENMSDTPGHPQGAGQKFYITQQAKDCKRKDKGKKKTDGPPSQTPSKQPITTARSSGKMAGPRPPNKATITANQDAKLANIAPPTTVPATLSAFQKTPAAILQTLHSTAPTLAMSMAIRTRAATLHAANNALTTEDTVPGNQGKPLVPRVTKRAQTIRSPPSQCPTTTTTSATHEPTANQELVAERQMPVRLGFGYLSRGGKGDLM